MKLYMTPGACSLAPHIALRETGARFDIEKVDLKSKTTASGKDFKQINPRGAVPALELDDGQVLTEAAVVLQYVADQKPESGLAPAWGTFERVRLQETLNFIATEVHKGFAPFFKPGNTDENKQAARELLAARFGLLDERLKKSQFVMGDRFTVADAYLFVMLTWAKNFEVDLESFAALRAFQQRTAERPAVKATLEAEKAA